MASRDKCIEEFRQLEQRFLRVAQHGNSDRDLDAASAVGGQIVWQATVDGLLPIQLPEPDFSQCSSDRSPAYLMAWITAALVYSDTNPLAFRSERRSSPDAAWIEVGRTSTDDWRIRAENYAQLCRDFIDLLSREKPAAQLVTMDDLTVMLRVSKKTISNRLSEWRSQGHDLESGEYRWQTIRPILVKLWPAREVHMPADYDALRDHLRFLRDLN